MTWQRCDKCSALLVILFLANFLATTTASIQCYKCSMTPPNTYFNETRRMCADFDYSERFIVDCPYSTLCMKKVFTVNLNDPVNGTLRDCAPQKYETQKYQDGHWSPEVKVIEEAYKEGCMQLDDKGQRSSMTRYCYCSGDLCNGARGGRLSPAVSTLVAVCWGLGRYLVL